MRIDLAAHVAWVAERPTGLRPKEERLLALLWSHANRVVATDWLVHSLYGAVSIESGRTRLKRLVCDIRAHLGTDFASRLRTAPRHGLVLYAASVTGDEDG